MTRGPRRGTSHSTRYRLRLRSREFARRLRHLQRRLDQAGPRGSRLVRTDLSSIKSMCGTGHGSKRRNASGGVVVTAIRDSIVPPTINFTLRDPACDLDYVPNIARRARIRTVLIHAQSIGGSHAALIFGRSLLSECAHFRSSSSSQLFLVGLATYIWLAARRQQDKPSLRRTNALHRWMGAWHWRC